MNLGTKLSYPEVTQQTQYSDGTTGTTVTPPFDITSEALVDFETPIYVQRGHRELDSAGAVLWVRDPDGALFRNGKRLGVNACQKALSYGGETFAQGWDGRWWEWKDGKSWVLLSGVVELDTTIFVA